MKTIKFLFLLVILGLLGLLYYQNTEFFLTKNTLGVNLKLDGWQWATPAIPNYAFWAICFALGLLLTGFKGMIKTFALGREIKRKDATIESLNKKVNDVQAKLDVFTHDPYIQKTMTDDATEAKGAEETAPATDG